MDLSLVYYIFLFGVSFYILIKSADFFIDSASIIGFKLNFSPLLIGLTIVAIGTSLPETLISFISIIYSQNSIDFIIGTSLGSNITNILLALGLFLIIAKKFSIQERQYLDVIFLILTSVSFSLIILSKNLNFLSIILFIIYLIYLVYLYLFNRNLGANEIKDLHTKPLKMSVFVIFVLSMIGLFIGSRIAIYSIENLSLIFMIPVAFLTLTTISIATSLPEIAIMISSAKKKEYLIGIGNILGTNIMNVGIIIGISGLFSNFTIDVSRYFVPVIFLIISTIVFSYLLLKKNSFDRKWGFILIFLYLVYLLSFFLI